MYVIQFINEEQYQRYDTLVSHKISKPTYTDLELLKTLNLWDELHALFNVLIGKAS